MNDELREGDRVRVAMPDDAPFHVLFHNGQVGTVLAESLTAVGSEGYRVRLDAPAQDGSEWVATYPTTWLERIEETP